MKTLLTLLLSFLFVVSLSAQNSNSNQNNNSNQFGNSGNVGIGTNNPNFPLEVYGQSKLHGKLGVDSMVVFEDSLIMKASRVEEDLIIDGDLIMNKYRISGMNIMRPVFFNDEGYIVTLEDPCKGDGSGGNIPYWNYEPGIIYVECPDDVKVGIGTSTPQQNLHVIGSQYITQNLGIGTATPQSKLDIETNGNTYNQIAAKYSNTFGVTSPQTNELFFVPRLEASAFNGLTLENDFGIFWNDNETTYNGASGLVIGPHNSNLNMPGLKIGGNGYIGIGTADPSKRLEISEGALFITGGSGTDGNTRFVISANSSSTNNFLRFENGTDVKFLVNSEGKLFATAIEVTLTTPLGDFVFDDDYKLKTLYEVEQFIKANKHLPGVPSEQTVKEEGLNLGEMNALLLQKIEELTLYVIEMNKKFEEQEKVIEELTNR